MITISTIIKYTVITSLVVVGWGLINSQPALAHEAETTEASANESVYSYVAQPGDSYTKIARKAIQTYGIINQINLSGAQIVFAETNLTVEAGSPDLEVGQKVEIAESHISDWVAKASQLTDSQKNRWNVYAARVDFNTDNVGE